MARRAQLTVISGNSKTGPMPVSGSDHGTCPRACSFYNNGCYAKQHHLGDHWNKVSDGRRGSTWAEFISQVRNLTGATLWRHNQFGDLPGPEDRIDVNQLTELVEANAQAGASGFTYTHKPVTWTAILRMQKARVSAGLEALSFDEARSLMFANRAAVAGANAGGFTVNVSCDSLTEVDEAQSFDWPTVVVLPVDAPTMSFTPGGIKVLKCPAQYNNDKNCANCGLCQIRDRKFAIGFEAHGAQKNRVSLTVVS